MKVMFEICSSSSILTSFYVMHYLFGRATQVASKERNENRSRNSPIKIGVVIPVPWSLDMFVSGKACILFKVVLKVRNTTEGFPLNTRKLCLPYLIASFVMHLLFLFWNLIKIYVCTPCESLRNTKKYASSSLFAIGKSHISALGTNKGIMLVNIHHFIFSIGFHKLHNKNVFKFLWN